MTEHSCTHAEQPFNV